MSNLNSVDTSILIVILVSILVGLMRGFIRELISLLTWIAAFVVSALFSGSVASAVTGSIPSATTSSSGATSVGLGTAHALATSSCFMGLFIVTLIIGSFIGRFASHLVDSQGVSMANRFLGGVFGFGRGLLVILVAIFLAQLTPIGSQAAWADSQFVKAYQPVVVWLNELVQPELSGLKAEMGNSLKNVNLFQHIDELKNNYQDSRASQLFQGN